MITRGPRAGMGAPSRGTESGAGVNPVFSGGIRARADESRAPARVRATKGNPVQMPVLISTLLRGGFLDISLPNPGALITHRGLGYPLMT